jgi:hypothetical protein
VLTISKIKPVGTVAVKSRKFAWLISPGGTKNRDFLGDFAAVGADVASLLTSISPCFAKSSRSVKVQIVTAFFHISLLPESLNN